MSAKPVRARQVDEFDGLAVIRLQRADVFLDRDARIVADALPQARQAIKECAFARIGTTDNRDAGGRLAGLRRCQILESGFRTS